jgi:hypothetical protein
MGKNLARALQASNDPSIDRILEEQFFRPRIDTGRVATVIPLRPATAPRTT